MSVEKPRIAMLGMHLESNAFAPLTTEKDFGYLEGETIIGRGSQIGTVNACGNSWLY